MNFPMHDEIRSKRDEFGCMKEGCGRHDHLHFHHVHNKRKAVLSCHALRTAIDEMRKCVLLCEDCHRDFHKTKKVAIINNLEYCERFLNTQNYINRDEPLKKGIGKAMKERLRIREERRAAFQEKKEGKSIEDQLNWMDWI